MKQLAISLAVISLAVIALAAQTAQAGHLGFGGDGSGLGGHHGDFGGGDFLGGLGGYGGLGGVDTERLQTRFETKLTNLQFDYDTGLANVTDFYSSDDYTNVVDGVQNLVDRYGLFLSGVERSVARLGDVISIANDDLTYYQNLLTDYQSRDDLSAERLARIEERLTNIQDRISMKVDSLTENQTTLSDNLSAYQTFSTDLSTYLSRIVTAGGGATNTSTTTTTSATAVQIVSKPVALRSLAASTTLGDEMNSCEMQQSALSATATPEPGTQLLGLVALGLLAMWRPTRGRPDTGLHR